MPPATRSVSAIAVLLAIVLVACTTAAAPPSVAPSAPTGSTVASPAPARATTPAASPSGHPEATRATADSWLVVGLAGAKGTRVILASTGEVLYDLPDGLPDATWGHLLVVTADGSATTIRDLVVQPGFGGPTEKIDGRWRLPAIGADPSPVGVSADGRTVVLVEEDRTATDGVPTHTRFAIVKVPFIDGWSVTAPRILDLAGSLEYDALSPDGSILYVVEHLTGPPAGHYQVRAVDVATGRLRPEVVVDKTGDGDEAMAGYPIAQVRRADGMVFTLYQGKDHPFIHALASADGWAVCIDLPASTASASTAADPRTLDWGMALRPDGESLLAANASLGLAVEVRGDLTIGRTARFDPTAHGAITLAKFGHITAVSAGRRVAIASDGTSAYVAGSNGIVRLRPDDLSVLGRLLPGVAVTTMAVTPDRSRLFALSGDGRILEVDLASGSVVRAVPNGGFDRLFAVEPW